MLLPLPLLLVTEKNVSKPCLNFGIFPSINRLGLLREHASVTFKLAMHNACIKFKHFSKIQNDLFKNSKLGVFHILFISCECRV